MSKTRKLLFGNHTNFIFLGLTYSHGMGKRQGNGGSSIHKKHVSYIIPIRPPLFCVMPKSCLCAFEEQRSVGLCGYFE